MEKNQDLKIERHGSDMDLRTFLSQTFVVYMKTYALHWNYEGPRFYGVHHLTEMQYQDMAEAIDQIAERMRA
ncbi:MAG: DNA starvation/stationary phase protection protein, partial [Bdellovibrio sp. CG10_big_fil_rev_8_21_14_0_10_47_8]